MSHLFAAYLYLFHAHALNMIVSSVSIYLQSEVKYYSLVVANDEVI